MKLFEKAFFRRPRILNQLHRAHLVHATSQTNAEELAALERHAAGATRALEIGTYQGVSAVHIVTAMAADGVLFCIDPWPEVAGRPNPCWLICERHLRRSGATERIRVIRGFSGEVLDLIPARFDFAFIDGDHSWDGLQTDWGIVSQRLSSGGIVCLHDTIIPDAEPWRKLDSMKFYQEVICKDVSFETVETVYSMTILRKR